MPLELYNSQKSLQFACYFPGFMADSVENSIHFHGGVAWKRRGTVTGLLQSSL